MGVLLRKVAGFSGLVHENMYRSTGWRFLTIGRSLERAAMMADLLATLHRAGRARRRLDLAIEIGDSAMTHRQRYAVTASHDSVVDLLALDPRNPRSILFHLTELQGAGRPARRRQPHRPDVRPARAMSSPCRPARRCTRPRRLTPEALRALRDDILALSDISVGRLSALTP